LVQVNMTDPRRVRRRLLFPLFQALLFIAVGLGLRLLLWREFLPELQTAGPEPPSFRELGGHVLAVGLHQDAVIALLLFAPLALATTLVREKWLEQRWVRAFLQAGTAALWAALTFLFIAEYYFFHEYRARFNTVAIDYLHYWTEVSANIREMYPVPSILTACAAAGADPAVDRLARSTTPRSLPAVDGRSVGGTGAHGLVDASQPMRLGSAASGCLNELAGNGLISAYTALVTRDLDYATYFPTKDPATAFAQARAAVAMPGEVLSPDPFSVQRQVPGDPNQPRRNVILLVEESLGSEFWGCLNCQREDKSLTPRLDRLAHDEGMLFTHLFADGNRTIRGLEAVLASFPPLPGDSILARPRTQGCETLASALGRDGYSTTFIYPGNGWFDGLRDFALHNGWERFVERKDFAAPAFETVWGASNEDLYRRVLDEARTAHATGRPFFINSMSVTNHQPFTYPDGRIAAPSAAHSRKNAVRYVDWALGEFFDAAKKEAFWQDTIFAVVADHGARIYGSQTIPLKSYEIPLLIVGPAVVPEPRREHGLGCQLDVAPTLLGLLGRPYTTTFYGHDLLRVPESQRRALLHHNRTIGLARGERFVTFSLGPVIDTYLGDLHAGTLAPLSPPDAGARALADEATALYQTADYLYMHRRYRCSQIEEQRVSQVRAR
jgi:phosphoglycerol transferase MdoB-like AlkP superfamily enzyme